jgi:hypothetical protein
VDTGLGWQLKTWFLIGIRFSVFVDLHQSPLRRAHRLPSLTNLVALRKSFVLVASHVADSRSSHAFFRRVANSFTSSFDSVVVELALTVAIAVRHSAQSVR